jgi:hypothetical protein
MKQLKTQLLLFSFMFVCLNLFAQNRTITGRVLGDDNNPLSAATISAKGTASTVASSGDGAFSINVRPGQVTLLISSVGFANKEVAVAANQSNITVTMDKANAQLGEVVVVDTAL